MKYIHLKYLHQTEDGDLQKMVTFSKTDYEK